MRKITIDACAAFEARRNFSHGNTDVLVDDDSTTLCLHGSAIAKRDSDGRLLIRTAGYPSATIKERLNGLEGVRVWHEYGVLHLNGKRWKDHEEWTEVKP